MRFSIQPRNFATLVERKTCSALQTGSVASHTCVDGGACVRLPEERWLGHGQGDALFHRKRGETLRRLSSASSSSSPSSPSSSPCWIMLKVSTRMIHASVRAYLSPRGLSTLVRSALFVNRAPFLDTWCTLHVSTRWCYLRGNDRVFISLRCLRDRLWKLISDSMTDNGGK